MEPEILATPRDPQLETSGLDAPTTAHRAVLEPPVRLNGGYHPTVVVTESVRHAPAAPGLANGHHLNGANGHTHANGHGEATWTRRAVPAASAAMVPHVTAHEGFYLRYGKRVLDLAGSAAALVVLSPLLLAVAIAVKLESRGPVFYRSTRIGKDGRPFTFLKFRSMFDGADRQRQDLSHLNEMDGPIFKISRDPRVTRIGRFLRVTSIDEVPQFLNVLRGDMSLVGPRPPIPEEVAQYEPWQLRRLDVRPGITCLWQISGRSRLGFKEWMRLDLEYIKHRSLWFDLRILVRTIPAVLSREGAY